MNKSLFGAFQIDHMLLICLKVKYGFHLDSLYGFLQHQDFSDWNTCLGNYECEAGTCAQDGVIYWLIRGCLNREELESVVSKLPLVEDGFLEMQLFELAGFTTFKCIFNKIS